MSNLANNSKRPIGIFIWLTICAGGLAWLLAVYRVDLRLLIITSGVIATAVFLAYRKYLKTIQAAVARAERAEERALELSHHISEQDRVREQLAQVEKLSALAELASGVAHDFNNTLAGILGRAQLMLRTNDPEKITRGLRIIIKTAEDGAQTVKRIQDFARQRRDHDFEPVSVDQILFEVSELTRPCWKDQAEAAGIHICLDLQIRSKARVMGDEFELREVMMNMVVNAVDAMPMGGQLTLSTEDIADSVVVSITDTGTGMAPEVRSRVFDPFFTTKGQAGMGLGLAVGFGIIRRHEGSITIHSEVSLGTTFRITLPAARAADGSLLTTPTLELPSFNHDVNGPPHEPSKSSQMRILVVDDEECIRDLLRELLESVQCSVSTAAGGPEALALFETREYDAVFTDVGMPGMSGWELASIIRRHRKEIPIAVITGWGGAVASNEQKEAGVDWVIAKPFTADRIFELVREIVARREIEDPSRKLSSVAA